MRVISTLTWPKRRPPSVAAALLAFALFGCASPLPAVRSPSPSLPSRDPAAPHLPFPTPLVTPTPPAVGWTRVESADLRDIPGVFAYAGRRLPDAFLILGGDVAGPALWSTTDGREWSRISLPGERGELAKAAAGNGDRAIAVGGPDEPENPRVWVRADGDWSAVAVPSAVMPAGTVIRDVAWAGSAFVAVGSTRGENDDRVPAAWASADGVAWEREMLRAREPSPGQLTSVAALGRRAVAAGGGAGAGSMDAIVATRGDGGQWSWVDSPGFASPEDEEFGRITSIGWVAVAAGTRREAGCRTDVCVVGEVVDWITSDGVVWTEIVGDSPTAVVAGDEAGFLGLHVGELGFEIVESGDAIEWRRAAPPLPADLAPAAIGRIGGWIVAVTGGRRELVVSLTP